MKKFLLLLSLTTGVYAGNAQTKAITDVGDEVLLYANGTWKYAGEKKHPSPHDSLMALNKTAFTRDKLATFLVKSKTINAGVYITPGEWEFEKSAPNAPSEYRFRLKALDSYAFIITEKVEVPFENLRDMVLGNAQKRAIDVEMIKNEYRMVNGVKVLSLEYKGTVNGIHFIWFGYFYSSSAGTVQLVTGTVDNLFYPNYKTLENFLNGFVVL